MLIDGETGTGKELVAQAIHERERAREEARSSSSTAARSRRRSPRRRSSVTSAARSPARSTRASSPFVEANGGTIFLDELGELPLDLQPKLLRALAERRVKTRRRSNRTATVDVRVVAATRRDLERAVNAGALPRATSTSASRRCARSVPPLRERLEDIPGARRAHARATCGAKSAWRASAARRSIASCATTGRATCASSATPSPSRLALADEGEPLDIAAAVGLKAAKPKGKMMEATAIRAYHDAKREALQQFERSYFKQLVDATNGNVAEISRRTGLQRTHVRKYLRLHGLREPRG